MNYLDFTIGIVGGGQLGRMLAFKAIQMGFKVGVIDPDPDAPALQTCQYPILGSYDNKNSLEKLKIISDVITYEFENVDENKLIEYNKSKQIYPSPEVLKISKNRIIEKKTIESFGIRIPDIFYSGILNKKEIPDLVEKIKSTKGSWFLKRTEGGYDGKFQVLINPKKNIDEIKKEITKIFEFFNKDELEIIVEKKIDYDFEFSIIATGYLNKNNQIESVFFPPFINYHHSGILRKTFLDLDFQNQQIEILKENIKKFIKSYKYIGVLTMEFFYKDSQIFFNEMAPRVHNSGHLTIEAFNYSQFHQHILSIAHFPIQKPEPKSYAAMLNIISPNFLENNSKLIKEILKIPNSHFHYYGKRIGRTNRKMGHITLTHNNKEELIENLNYLEKLIYKEVTDFQYFRGIPSE